MRNPVAKPILAVFTALVFSSIVGAQTAQPNPQQGGGGRNPWKYYPADRAVGDGGPAPRRDLTGTWAGPQSGAGVPGLKEEPAPPLTPLGKQMWDLNKPIGKYSPAGTNDPTARFCDPLGFPQNAINSVRALSFANMPGRIVVLIQFQDIWREIWTDGRALPTTVGGTGKDSLDPRYNGYSVGHWEDDYTLVVDTTGLDDRTWATKSGYSMDAHVRERFTRTDHNDLKLTVTMDDPKIYTKPFFLGTVYYRWVPNQQIDEKLCVPSEVLEYLKTMGDPAGSDPSVGSPTSGRQTGVLDRNRGLAYRGFSFDPGREQL
jgi:hypothetical protein